MKELYKKFTELDINTSLINLDKPGEYYPYYCYPLNAQPIGYEGCIMYCFVEGYGETVFASNPENYSDEGQNYPLAENFTDFIRLILACGSVNPAEQIVWMGKEMFEDAIKSIKDNMTKEQENVLAVLAEEFRLTAMENPYEYVKNLQKDFDYSKLQYSDEYYDTLGITKPQLFAEIKIEL